MAGTLRSRKAVWAGRSHTRVTDCIRARAATRGDCVSHTGRTHNLLLPVFGSKHAPAGDDRSKQYLIDIHDDRRTMMDSVAGHQSTLHEDVLPDVALELGVLLRV